MRLVGAFLIGLSLMGGPIVASAESGGGDGPTKLEQARALVAERQAERNGGGQSAADSPPDTTVGGTAVKLFSALGLALGAFFIGLHVHRRMTGATTPAGRTRRMQIVERLPIASKTALVLVEVDGRPLVLTVGADRVTAIDGHGSELTDVERLCRDEAALVAVGS